MAIEILTRIAAHHHTVGIVAQTITGHSQHRRAPSDVLGLFSNNAGSWPNGMKLASDRMVYQRLTQFLPGFDHTREALGPPFLDARLDSMRADGGDHHRSSRDRGAWRAELPQRIPTADPLHTEVLEPG
jgi:hypothetical protein